MSRTIARALLVAWLLVGCSGSESTPSAVVDAGLGDASDPFDEEDDGFEGCPDSIARFALDMQATGAQARITARVLAASNVPPLRYLNDWTVQFSAGGSPLADVQLTMACPFMPVHGHDGIVKPIVEPLPAPGQLRIRGMNFNMRGPWEVQLTVHSATAGDDYVVFHICVEE